jgi:hypothetical protein
MVFGVWQTLGSPDYQNVFTTITGANCFCRVTDLWAYTNEVTFAFSRPGKSMDNTFIESFNGSFRYECLNCHWFISLEDADVNVELWCKDYNQTRIQSAHNNLPSPEYVAKMVIYLAEFTRVVVLITGPTATVNLIEVMFRILGKGQLQETLFLSVSVYWKWTLPDNLI